VRKCRTLRKQADPEALEFAVGCRLAFSHAVEFAHALFHLFSRGVGGGTDALNAQLEVVGVGRADQSLFIGDQFARIEIEERLTKVCMPYWLVPRHRINELTASYRIDDAIADVSGCDHHFDCGDAAPFRRSGAPVVD